MDGVLLGYCVIMGGKALKLVRRVERVVVR